MHRAKTLKIEPSKKPTRRNGRICNLVVVGFDGEELERRNGIFVPRGETRKTHAIHRAMRDLDRKWLPAETEQVSASFKEWT